MGNADGKGKGKGGKGKKARAVYPHSHIPEILIEVTRRAEVLLKGFVRHNCNKAEIRVRLSNVGGDEGLAYR